MHTDLHCICKDCHSLGYSGSRCLRIEVVVYCRCNTLVHRVAAVVVVLITAAAVRACC